MEKWMLSTERLVRENEQLKIENRQLQTHLQNLTNNTLEEITLPVASSLKKSIQQQNTLYEKQFRAGLLQNEHRTSSPVDFKSFIESSAYVETNKDTGFESEESLEVKAMSERLLGEIAYQLDRRILSHVFQCNKRFYGYNLRNIPDKIKEVSTHPLTGTVDEDYRHHLTHRYDHIKDMLSQLSYKFTLHPQFSEFVVNTYGILRKRPEEGSSLAKDYNNQTYLRSKVIATAPIKLQNDLLLLLNCLCYLSQKDGKPLFIW